MRVSSQKISKAIQRLLEYKQTDSYQAIADEILSSDYDRATDTWEVDAKSSKKIEMLNGPYYLTILKINKIQNE